jgi:F-type H+-transporting ATPase subunit alpha
LANPSSTLFYEIGDITKTLISEINSFLYCCYSFIAQRSSFIYSKISDFYKYCSEKYTSVVNTIASSAAAASFLCPFVSCAASEWFRDNSFYSLIIYDDLSKHAVSYR